jgi:hypothetical protein
MKRLDIDISGFINSFMLAYASPKMSFLGVVAN